MKEILLASCAAWIWVYVLGGIRFKFKPFNCEMCMAGWLCGIISLPSYVWYEIPFRMCAAMVSTIILTELLSKK